MYKKIKFVKMHGLGNDFVIINQADLAIDCDFQKLAINISDRRLGVGCDQFILYKKNQDHYEMAIYNQDGSSARMCGNASRCLTKLIYTYFGDTDIVIKVFDRELICQVLNENEFSVNMGSASFNKDWMILPEKIYPIAERYMIEPKEVICVDVGNPHIVIFSNLSDQDKEYLGKKLQEKILFPDGVNVNFADVKENIINLSVWERGVGFTLACGSGACASFAAATKLGFVDNQAEVVFRCGSLNMSKHKEDIIMSGPAAFVSSGEFHYE